jgi:hypothetical protein
MRRVAMCLLGLGLLLPVVACGSDAAEPAGEDVASAESGLRVRCTRNYVGHSAAECAVIRFVCVEGQHYFSNKKGCGCTDCP